MLSLTFSISAEGSRMGQALELSLFTPHKRFIFLLGVFTDESMQLFVSLFFCKDSKFTGCKNTVNFDCFRFLCRFIAPWSMVLLIFIVPVHRDFSAFSLCPALSKRGRCFLLPSQVANIYHQANVCHQRS